MVDKLNYSILFFSGMDTEDTLMHQINVMKIVMQYVYMFFRKFWTKKKTFILLIRNEMR